MTTKEQFQSCENNVLLNHIFCNIKIIFTNKKMGCLDTCTKSTIDDTKRTKNATIQIKTKKLFSVDFLKNLNS